MPGKLFDFDIRYHRRNLLFAGVDESGRGPVAGPLVASAVVMPSDLDLPADDSKRLSDNRRRELLPRIRKAAVAIGLGIVDPAEIDELGMSKAIIASFRRAYLDLGLETDLCLIDGLPVRDLGFPAEFITGGDGLSLSIACSSIVAKVSRDDIMIEADAAYPGYGFSTNKGYLTPLHMRALERLGPSPIHRMSFAPFRDDGQLRLQL